MLVYGYIAKMNNIPVYVGIGRINRYHHVNSGKSHNPLVNILRYSYGKDFELEHFEFCSPDQAKDWEIEQIKFFGRRLFEPSGILCNISAGGDLTWLGCKWYRHPTEFKQYRYLEGSQPRDWEPGRADFKFNKYAKYLKPSGSKKYRCLKTGKISQLYVKPLDSEEFHLNTKWVYNLVNNLETKMLSRDSEIPMGWSVGRPLVSKAVWYTNKQTGESKYSFQPLDETVWARGRGDITGAPWFFNPKTNQYKQFKDTPPTDWVLKTYQTGMIRASNDITGKNGFFDADSIPDGWTRGSSYLTKSKWCYNPNTGEVKRLAELPEGWKLGRKVKSNVV